MEVEESAVKNLNENLQKNQCMVFCMLKSLINIQKSSYFIIVFNDCIIISKLQQSIFYEGHVFYCS